MPNNKATTETHTNPSLSPQPSIPWPSITFETLPWVYDAESFDYIPKNRRRHITDTYSAAIPSTITRYHLAIPAELQTSINALTIQLARFDAAQHQRSYNLPALLLRSESAASSQIENLTSSARNVALAQLSSTAPANAQLIAGNLYAMRSALQINSPITPDAILAIHDTLAATNLSSMACGFRTNQVWIGGSPYSPHEALYVPPHAKRIPALMNDLTAFCNQSTAHPIVKAALAHAQFESIHPFADGNGRTGRALIHTILANEDLISTAHLPISAGLLHNTNAYMQALTEYQNGNPYTIIEQLNNALEIALQLGVKLTKRIDAILLSWSERITERANAKIHQLPAVLVEQPVVNISYIANELAMTPRAASTLVQRACEYHILRPIGNKHRSAFFQSDELIEVLEEASSATEVRRIISQP